MALKTIFSFIVIIHALIHLLGFIKEWNLAKVEQLTGKTLIPLTGNLRRVFGILWLIIALVFIIAAAGYIVNWKWWWLPAFIAVIISQALIIIYWIDAKAGTIANIIIILAALISYADFSFNYKAGAEANRILSGTSIDRSNIMTEEKIKNLPAPVQKWLRRSNLLGKEIIQTVRLRQKGMMLTKERGSWMDVDAVQYFTTDRPAFVWIARVQAALGIYISGIDKYEDGRGSMLIKLLSLISLADSKGSEIDQGTLLRFLSEIIWFPTAALNDYIKWEEIDSRSARAIMSYGNVSASGVFKFDENFDPVGFEAMRFGDFDGKISKELWVVTAKEYKEFNGIRIPSEGEVTWKFKRGDFTWFKVKITDIEYNMSHLYTD